MDSDVRARGVRLESGKEIASEVVISNATPKVTFLDLLPSGCLPSSFEREVHAINYTSATCKINGKYRLTKKNY